MTIVGEEGATIRGSFLEDNHIPSGTNVDEWLQSTRAYDASSGPGILIDSGNVTIQGLQIEGFYQGVRFAGGPQVLVFFALASVVAVVQNLVGVALAIPFDLHPLFGVLSGSVTMAGGPAR